MSAEYYEDLSRASSESQDESDEELDDDDDDDESPVNNNNNNNADLPHDDRCILHVDVDCFYCQCEMIDRKIPEERPFAIGQKHIIVTCNYAARKCGVKKLELRDKAHRKCPNLLILEGSDLERYRIHARKIYQSFRDACKRIDPHVTAAKGAMDEMNADLSVACRRRRNPTSVSASSSLCMDNFSAYVYGEQNDGNEKVTLTEDQTGDSVVVFNNPVIMAQQQISGGGGDIEQCQLYQNKVQRNNLQQAACFARQIQQTIYQETGFTVTCGISVNPLLSKWAGDLRKPNSINVLYPWLASHLIACMPLRKIPGVGHTTLKTLEPCLERRHLNRKQQQPVIWTCRDLLQVPLSEVIVALDKLSSTGKSGREQSRILLQKCRGIDISTVEDDEGGLPKTISVENSFKRGSVLTQERVCHAMEDLYNRLPRLLHERAGWSTSAKSTASPSSTLSLSSKPPPPRDYPTTIRLTARVVVKDNSMQSSTICSRRRPFVTHSKQVAFDGQAFMNEKSQPAAFLRRCVNPLLRDLVFNSTEIDVTRLNIAVTNFRPSTLVSKHKSSPPMAMPVDKPSAPIASKSCILGKTAVVKRTPTPKRQRIDQYFDVKTSK